MKTLECGCELSEGNRLLSLCAIHGEHMHAVHEIAKHPRAEVAIDRDFQKDLVKVLAPVMVSAHVDPQTTAESMFQHIHEIMRRLD